MTTLSGSAVERRTEQPLQRRSFWKRHSRNIEAWSLLGPVWLYMFIFSIFPLLFTLYLSFQEWNGVTGAPKWVGLANYIEFFTSANYLRSIWQTFKIGVIGMAMGMTIPFFVALLMNYQIKGKNLYRTVWYIPVVTSYAVMSQIMLVILNPMDGTLNKFLMAIGLSRIDWQLSTFWMIFWVTIFGLWKGMGGSILLYLAGLQSIDPTMYEAAKVDGAGPGRRLFSITVPLMKPILSFVFVTSMIGMFQVFEPIYFLTKGGPNGSTVVIVYQIFRDAFTNFQFGMASVGSVVVLVIVLIGTVFSLRLSKSVY